MAVSVRERAGAAAGALGPSVAEPDFGAQVKLAGGLPLTPSCPTRNSGPQGRMNRAFPSSLGGAVPAGKTFLLRTETTTPSCHGNSFLAQQALASSRTALPPADHVLPTPDLRTAGLGVRKARACVTQASPGVPRPHSASLPQLCLGDSFLAAFPVYDSGP